MAVAQSLQCAQCAITVFDGLLPEPHNQQVTELLFVLAHWHAMAKLRMHNDLTLAVMEEATTSLGKKLREFSQKTCSSFATKELSREYNSRLRREGRKHDSAVRTMSSTSPSAGQAVPDSEVAIQRLPSGAPSSQSGQICEPSTHMTPVSQSHCSNEATASNAEPGLPVGVLPRGAGRRNKTLNLSTFKGHSASDYVDTVRKYGTCDSYSTEPVCYKYLQSLIQLIYL